MPTKYLDSPVGPKGSYSFGGGAETIFTSNNFGGSGGYTILGNGGDDSVNGSIGDDIIHGGDGDDTVFGGAGADTIFGGNDDGSADASKGQNPAPTNTLIGDGFGTPVPGNTDFLEYSDSLDLTSGTFDASNDTITGGVGSNDDIFGDFRYVSVATGTTFNGGADLLNAGTGGANFVYGDAFEVSGAGAFIGGNDELTGADGATINWLYGDVAEVVSETGSSFTGGGDTIRAGDALETRMFGDAQFLSGSGAVTVQGGADTLYAGTGSDSMYGDWDPEFETAGAIGGHDRFVFETGSLGGFDVIYDFHQGEDVIDLSGTDISWADLDSSGDTLLLNSEDSLFITIVDMGGIYGDSMVINLGAASDDPSAFTTLRIAGVTELDAGDFFFG